MDWQTLLTAFAGALGGTATALAIVGVFGKTILEHWFKKGYKKWESELEQRLKEDFKRFEAVLDKLASRDETRFNYHFASLAEATKEIFRQANTVQTLGAKLLYKKTMPLESRKLEDNKELLVLTKEYKNKLMALAEYANGVYLIDEATKNLLRNFFGQGVVVMAYGEYINAQARQVIHDNFASALKELQAAFRRFVIEGDENEKSLPGER